MLEKLNPRERLLLIYIGGSAAVLILIYLAVLLITKRFELRDESSKAIQNIHKMSRLERQIASLPPMQNVPDLNQLKSQIFNALEKNGLKGNISDRTESISKKEEMLIVNININGVQFSSVMDFVYDIEYGRGINASIGKLTFNRPLAERELYDVKISVYVRKPRKKP